MKYLFTPVLFLLISGGAIPAYAQLADVPSVVVPLASEITNIVRPIPDDSMEVLPAASAVVPLDTGASSNPPEPVIVTPLPEVLPAPIIAASKEDPSLLGIIRRETDREKQRRRETFFMVRREPEPIVQQEETAVATTTSATSTVTSIEVIPTIPAYTESTPRPELPVSPLLGNLNGLRDALFSGSVYGSNRLSSFETGVLLSFALLFSIIGTAFLTHGVTSRFLTRVRQYDFLTPSRRMFSRSQP